tara:strand:+ start:666 stop:1019 length:354 start_codon:yes stop_codon:yes gene_type:complete
MESTNSIYYKVSGTLTSDFGEVITNPVLKINVNSNGAESDGLLKCEFKVYFSEESYLQGKYFFKAWDSEEDQRIINFTYPVTDVPTWGFITYKELQRKIIADQFGWLEEDVVLVEEA